ncbi:A4/G1 family peptidase [Caballeronia sp. SEWSISQ10-4 2]|uniref:G1 family glutamic endopeptidase n=1 Tax=Caballeronia sp. SEWSISQ10-4 2 TaxID=2937438 RepID=UPI0026561F19|nr:G1 family glutamic endopeptidase [Caballeronia sp. SEWSISQ10-4 2]MDN7178750.1 A4/G1 family peptidase [Caballeronia sp. SEWSISQ10-4 2]
MAHPTSPDLLSRLQTFESPPAEFDPQIADAKQLRRHGFPRRPDPEKEPQLMRLWRRAFTRAPRLHMVKAELAIDPIMSRRDPQRNLKSDFNPSGWGGVIVPTASLGFSPYEPANTVFAEWVVPEIFPVAGDPSTPLTVGFWVGLDGSDPTSYELLQAGTAATITGNSVSYWAWTEWYTSQYGDPAVQVTNFAIQPGDMVSFLVCSPQPDQGFVSMMNYRTQQATSVGIPARPGVTSVGGRAEWIVEGISADLPDFSPAVFTNISAGTQHHSFSLSPGGSITNIAGSGGSSLTQAYIASPTTALVLWEGSA